MLTNEAHPQTCMSFIAYYKVSFAVRNRGEKKEKKKQSKTYVNI